jgi:ribosomal protein uS17/ribosomal protein L29
VKGVRAKDLRGNDPEELRRTVRKLEEDLFKHRLKKNTNQLENTMLIRNTRRDIARVNTVLAERTRSAGTAKPRQRQRRPNVPGHKIHKRRMIGVVTSDKMNKTRVVMVERRVSDPKYGKYLNSRTKYKAHDEKNEFKTGDRVQIVESRPLSSDKRWRVEKLIERPQEA